MRSPISAIAHDRIVRLQRRIANGSYAVDHWLLAETLAAQEDDHFAPPATLVRAAAVAMLQTALVALDHRSAMLLQLHFVEQLQAIETALIMGIGEHDASHRRRHLLRRLHAIIAAE
ncbi:MAG: hypothetical protein HC788_14550 [Sphingopyxis sp.]|nr:hypothetical protein [Sphingopyxis sp.]